MTFIDGHLSCFTIDLVTFTEKEKRLCTNIIFSIIELNTICIIIPGSSGDCQYLLAFVTNKINLENTNNNLYLDVFVSRE